VNQDHASAPQAAKTMLDMQATPARPIAYDKAIAFNICDRFGNGQGVEAIMVPPAVYTSLASIKAKLATKIGFWQNEPNLRDPTAELGRLSSANKLGE
jgi:hypothetical protein